MPEYEIVFRGDDGHEEVAVIGFENLVVGQPFEHDGLRWRITEDAGPAQQPGCVARLIAEDDR
jgi:hypothetical protein